MLLNDDGAKRGIRNIFFGVAGGSLEVFFSSFYIAVVAFDQEILQKIAGKRSYELELEKKKGDSN